MADELDRILEEKYSTPLRSGYKPCDGFFMLNNFSETRKKLENFEVRDDDVWVSSFAKAGTTWTQEMVWLIANDLDYEGAEAVLTDRFPFIDGNYIVDFQNVLKDQPNCVLEFPDGIMNAVDMLNNMKNRRFIKTHMPWQFLPLQLQNQTTKAKIIHVLRNPKDVCVSYHHHTRAMEGATGTLDDFFKLFIAGKVIYGPYWDNILSYWKRRDLPNLLIITYEDMKRDLPSVIRKVAEFLDKKIPEDDQMEKLTKHLSFHEMKKNRAVNFEPVVEFVKQLYGDKYESDGIFMRSGVVGSHKSQMTEDMIQMMDEWTKKNTAGTELSFSV